MRRLVVAIVCTLGFAAAAIAVPATSDAASRATLTPGHWTSTGPASTSTKTWTFVVPRTGYVLLRSTGATTDKGAAPVALTNSAGTVTIMRLAVQASDSEAAVGYASATRRLPPGRYALTGKPQPNESIRIDLVPDAVAVLDSSLAQDNSGRTRVVGDVINGTAVTRSGVRLHVTFRNARGAVLGRVTVSPLLNRIPQGGTDVVAALVKPPGGTARVSMTTASNGIRSHAVPGGLRVGAEITTECTAPVGSGFCEFVSEPEAYVSNTSDSTRHGLVVVVVDRDYVGETYEVDIAAIPNLAAGASDRWGGIDPDSTTGFFLASPWLPIEVRATDGGTFTRNPLHLNGAMNAYAQAAS